MKTEYSAQILEESIRNEVVGHDHFKLDPRRERSYEFSVVRYSVH